jgi:hypothetical protein
LVTPLRATNRKAAYGSPLSRVAEQEHEHPRRQRQYRRTFLIALIGAEFAERTLTARLAKAEERKNYAYHDNQADQIDDSIHDISPMYALT